MLTTLRTRADDVRALAGAIVLGSSAGVIIGATYLFGGASKPAHPISAVAAPLQARAAPSVGASPPPIRSSKLTTVLKTLPGVQAALRNRFGVEAGLAGFTVRPFRLQQVADASADLRCLTEAVYFEARGEASAGQQAVAQVVLNRVRHPAFPKTICAVVHQHIGSGCQFSFACTAHAASVDSVAWRRAETVAAGEMHGAVMAAVGNATHFQTVRSGPFAGLLKVAQIGAHIFYRFGGHAGAPNMVRQTPGGVSEPARIELARLDVSGAATTTVIAPAVEPHAIPPPLLSRTVTDKPLAVLPPLAPKAGDATLVGPAYSRVPTPSPSLKAEAPEVKPVAMSLALAQS